MTSPIRQRTPTDLVRTAERLFAMHGIDGVSLRQIGSEAGHRNPSAVQYHFGSKAELLQAIIQSRLPPINARRLELFERVRLDGREGDLRALAEVMGRPLLEVDATTSHYVMFLARLMAHRSELRAAYATALDDALSAKRVTDAMRAALGHLPARLRRHRVSVATELMVHVIANRRARVADGDDAGLTEELFAGDLFDSMAGVLLAPHTPIGPGHDAS